MDKRRLQTFLGRPSPEQAIPLPTPQQVLYSPPNPGGTAKACGNCALWIPNRQRCFLHAEDVVATKAMLCNHHVYGEPGRAADLPAVNGGFARAEMTGLCLPKGEQACRTCKWFKLASHQVGHCAAVQDPKFKVFSVQPMARCSRWA